MIEPLEHVAQTQIRLIRPVAARSNVHHLQAQPLTENRSERLFVFEAVAERDRLAGNHQRRQRGIGYRELAARAIAPTIDAIMNRLGAAVLHQSAVRRNKHPSEARIRPPEPELEPGLAPKWLAIPVAHDQLRSNHGEEQRGPDAHAACRERLSRLRAGPTSNLRPEHTQDEEPEQRRRRARQVKPSQRGWR